MTRFRWLAIQEVIALHDEFLNLYGGAAGVRDMGLLEAALARPRTWAGFVENAHVLDIAARYSGGLVRNHPFVDGNKRTAFIASLTFADIHGFPIVADQKAATEAVLKLASGETNEDEYAAFLKTNTDV